MHVVDDHYIDRRMVDLDNRQRVLGAGKRARGRGVCVACFICKSPTTKKLLISDTADALTKSLLGHHGNTACFGTNAKFTDRLADSGTCLAEIIIVNHLIDERIGLGWNTDGASLPAAFSWN